MESPVDGGQTIAELEGEELEAMADVLAAALLVDAEADGAAEEDALVDAPIELLEAALEGLLDRLVEGEDAPRI